MIDIWRLKIPPTVRIFTYLWLEGRLLTHDVMERRELLRDLKCATCANCALETALHLFVKCSTAIWSRVSLLLGHRIMYEGDNIQLTFNRSSKNCRERMSKQTWGIFFMASCWFLWKERNSSVFEGKLRDPRWVDVYGVCIVEILLLF